MDSIKKYVFVLNFLKHIFFPLWVELIIELKRLLP